MAAGLIIGVAGPIYDRAWVVLVAVAAAVALTQWRP